MLSNISGFPELLPQDQIAFNQVIHLISQAFESHGFVPMDTPAVEKMSTLLSKGNDQEIYGVHRSNDPEARKANELGLRFDLTVPLARYVAQHYSSLTFPYRRYHIAPVWRGERPQSGRYRQFYQCDIDIIGDNHLPADHDIEILSVMQNVLLALGLKRFVIKVNNTLLLTGLLKSFGIAEEQISSVMRVLDKSEKISRDDLLQELSGFDGMDQHHIGILFDLIFKTGDLQPMELIADLNNFCSHKDFKKGVFELQDLLHKADSFNLTKEHLKIDLGLARGLNYYTGTLYEAKWMDHPEIGSIGGGGRYANLAGHFTRKRLPGVGMSIGISRIFPKLIEDGLIVGKTQTVAQALVTIEDKNWLSEYMALATTLRQNKINTEVYFGTKGLSDQMKYADKKGFEFAILANSEQLKNKQFILKNLLTREQVLTDMNQLINAILSKNA